MSALIVKKIAPEKWEIIRQSPKITAAGGLRVELGSYQLINITSAGHPDFNSSPKAAQFFIRGNSPGRNNESFSVPASWEANFRKAVLEINRKHGNNSEIEESDVIMEGYHG